MFDFKMVFKLLLLSAILLLNFSCKVDQVALEKAASDSGIDLSSLNKGSLTIVGGNNQIVAQNTIATKNLEVIARDSDGVAKANEEVTFEVLTENGGLLTGAVISKTVTTSASGKASVSFTGGSDTGEVIIYASSASGNVSFTQTIINSNNGSAGTSLIIIKGNNQSVEQSTTATDALEVLALDSTGAPIQNISINFEVLTTGAGSLSGSSVTTGSSGRASVNFTASNQLGSATIIATSIAGSAAFTVNTIEAGAGSVNPLGSTLLMVKGNGSIVEQNTTTILEVLALNSAGLPIPNIDVTFEVLTSGTLSNPQPSAGTQGATGLVAKTGTNGRASVTYTAPSTLGNATIIARSSAGSAAFNLSVGVQGIGSTLSISNGNGQVIVPNTKATEDLEVIATSASGSPLSGITVTFTVTTTSGGVLSNSQGILVTQTDANGKAKTSFTSSNTTGPISVLASSSVGSVNFALNTSSNGGAGGGGSISFNPESLSPASGSWVNTNVGAAPSKTITVTNTASYGLYINSIFTSAGTEFTIISDDCPKSPTPLASTDSCSVIVSFSPSSSAISSKFLFLNWSALDDGSNGQNAVLPLQGSGPPALTFGGIALIDNVTTDSLRINWNAATGGTVSQYRLYRINNGVPSLVTNLASNILTYSISGLSQNTVYTYRVRAVNTANEEDGNNNDVSMTTDTSPAPILTDVGNFVFPTNPLYSQGTALSLDFNKTNATPAGDADILAYSCKFSRQVTGASAGKINCNQSALGGSFTFNTTTGVFSWTPKLGTQGVFEFLITGTDRTYGDGFRYFTVNVAHPYAAPNLSTILADFRASFAGLTEANSSGDTNWSNLTGPGSSGQITSGSPQWNGSVNNTTTDPQRLTFDGSSELDLGTQLGGLNKFMIDYWISNPESTFTDQSVVMKMDTDATDNGFKISQNTTGEGKRALRLDFERSYSRLILADDPSAYWRMDNASGTNFTESINGNTAVFGDGAYGTTTSTGLSLSQSGATLGELSSKSITVDTNKLNIPNVARLKPTGDFTVEFWVKYANKTTPANHSLYTINTADGSNGFSLYFVNGVLTAKYKPRDAAVVTLTPTYTNYGHLFDENWHLITFVSTNSSKILYVDGKPLSSSLVNNGPITWPATPDNAHIISGAPSSNPASVDEVAFYEFAISTNQIVNHLGAGDHFNKMQALYPANAISQTRPLAYWRMGDGGNQGNYQDYSGNQNNLFDPNWATYGATGVYLRPGGSGLDTDGAAAQHQDGYRLLTYNTRGMLFNNKFTYSAWLNWRDYQENYRHAVLFSFVKYGSNYHGFYSYVSNEGYLIVAFDKSWGGNPTSLIRSASPILPSWYSTQFPRAWYHVAITFDGSKANAQDRVQFYVNGMPVKMDTPTGTLPTTLSNFTGPDYEFQLGTWRVAGGDVASKANNDGNSLNNRFFHDEDAMWERVLGGNEIRAQANEGSLRYCDIPVTSRTLDPVNAKPFDFINMLYDGTTISVTRNSKIECALRAGINLTNEALDLKVGAPVNGFRGHLADLRIHGTDGASVAQPNDGHIAFLKSSDQHRIVPLGNIVTDSLVRHYEASAAFDGMRPYGAGCENSKTLWTDIGTQNLTNKRQEVAFLHNFTNCTSGNGWNGDGSPTNPYRLTFDGNDDWVDLGTNSLAPYAANKFSVCMWIKTTKNTNMQIFHRSSGNYQWGDIDLVWDPSWFYFMIAGTSNGTRTYANGVVNSGHSNFRNGNWHYLCGVYDGAKIYMYLDGVSIATPQNHVVNIYGLGSFNGRTTLASGYDNFFNWPYGGRFQGDIGAVHLYNNGLTVDQVKQNCNAQAANYNVTTCAP